MVQDPAHRIVEPLPWSIWDSTTALSGFDGLLFADLFRFELALFGVAAAACLMQFTFRDQYFHPWSFWEGAYFAAGLLLIHRRAIGGSHV